MVKLHVEFLNYTLVESLVTPRTVIETEKKHKHNYKHLKTTGKEFYLSWSYRPGTEHVVKTRFNSKL